MLREVITPNLFQLIYSSEPFGYDDATLAGILLDARRCNTRDHVTGALICRQDIFVQLLEGPKPEVEAAFDRICKDDRHVNVELRYSSDIRSRLFGKWAMLHDPAISWLWTRKQIHDGALASAKAGDFLAVFEDLSAKVRA